jgi:undecaprenyl-diphosphatase
MFENRAVSRTDRTHRWLRKWTTAEKIPIHRVAHQWATSTIARLIRGGRAEFTTLAAVFLLAMSLLAFAQLAGEVFDGGTRSFDRAVLMWMRTPGRPSDPVGPPWFEEAVRDVTSLGGTSLIVLITATVAGFLAMTGTRHAALLMVVSVSGGSLLMSALKQVFGRTRPDLVEHSARVFTESFPSGHATLSAITYLTLGALLARVQTRRALKAYSLGVAIALTALVGVSRVYLGVHWPTDVLAGWCLGAAWAIACWLAAAWLQRRGDVERRIES